jgi:hypothetical protein
MSVTKADPTELTIWTVQMGLSRTQMRLSHASTLVGVELNRRLKNVLFLSKPLFNFAASQVYFFPKFGVWNVLFLSKFFPSPGLLLAHMEGYKCIVFVYCNHVSGYNKNEWNHCYWIFFIAISLLSFIFYSVLDTSVRLIESEIYRSSLCR